MFYHKISVGIKVFPYFSSIHWGSFDFEIQHNFNAFRALQDDEFFQKLQCKII